MMSQSEMFNLVVFGTIAAMIACYQTYDDLKNVSIEAEPENKMPRENWNKQKLARDDELPEPTSDELESQVSRILSDFSSAKEKSKRKREVKNNLPVRTVELGIFPGDSNAEQSPKPVVIADSESEDLEWEVTKVVTIMNSENQKPVKQPVQKQDLLTTSPGAKDGNGGHPQRHIPQTLKKRKDISATRATKLKKQVSQSIPDRDSKKKAAKRKSSKENAQLIGIGESDQLGEIFEDDLPPGILEEDKSLQKVSSKRTEPQLLHPEPELDIEEGKSKSKPKPKDGFLSQYYDSGKKDDQSLEQFPTQESKDSKKSILEPSPAPISEIEEPKTKPIPGKEELSPSKELEESVGIFLDEITVPKLEEIEDPTTSALDELEDQVTQPPSEFDDEQDEFEQESFTIDDEVNPYIERDESIDTFLDTVLTGKPEQGKDISAHDSIELEQDFLRIESGLDSEGEKSERKRLTIGDKPIRSTKLDMPLDSDREKSISQIPEEDVTFSYLNLTDLERQVLQTTTELSFLIRRYNRNQLTQYIENVYRSIGEDDKAALINTEIFYLWCMTSTIFEFSIDSDFRKKLVKFFNKKVINLYLKRKGLRSSDATKLTSNDFKNFSYYSNQVRVNKIHLNSSFHNSQAEILFGKIVLTKLLENIGDRKINVDKKAILLPAQIYYELKQRVVKILNDSTESICYS